MDFNDLKLRIERIYTAILGLSTDGVETSTHVNEVIDIATGTRGTIVNFGAHTDAERINMVFNAISLIASMKDHLKTKLKSRNSKVDVEQLINSNLSLSLILDLNNKDKHGDPLSRKPRTDKNPKIGQLFEAAAFDGKSAIIIDPLTGKVSDTIGAPKVVIQGDVLDDKNALIMDIDKMFDDALTAIEEFIKVNKLNT